ncbi:uncharacterized protein LOC103308233 [Acyrthosiphon pisum]|uniref:SWIM-type domain-containing protein n=1 Tax=Acyrthosiphon pisum TaxID=7029 RepID=A0A8R2H651_ACYPI|nr:uncharacterized protein LOC103308233 [Acyrthosiphon pisum]|eukprot:XP_016657057.1 PREDICTED: uncharacterized protein LOC103308233 [Acyrthosiphon pisum]
MSEILLNKRKRNDESSHYDEEKEKCSLCNSMFSNIGNRNKHMQKAHGVDNRSSVRLRVVGNKTYYVCHRSGSSRTTGTGKRMKWSQSHNTGKICPAGMTTTNIDGYISVEFRRTHVGHALNMKFLHLSKEERDELAGKIKSGVTFERILDDIRKSVTSTECVNRFHAVDKRDLYNIKRDYDLDRDIVHTNDAFSTEIWVQEQMLLKEKSPVTYFKMQGCEKEGPLLKDDFMIVIMTPYQIDVLSKYATDRICVDSTHGTTSHDFQLTTLLVVDEFGAGCPVAFCISNRIDSVAMSRFFLSVKEKVGFISTKILMSDDTTTYINAWSNIMSNPQHHLLCNWHVDRSWRKNLIKIKSLTKQSEVYKACRTLMEIMDIDQFENSLECFLAMCEDDVETKDFGIYFKTYYSQRPKAWAFCYRLDLSLNTNMYLEAMHKKLKYCYMHGKQNRRVDKCISLLMRFSRDMMFERIIRMMKNKPTFRMEQIAHSHLRSINIESKNCMGCPLACPSCHICVHKFTCTCVDYKIKGNFCKHVHACIRVSEKKDIAINIDEDRATSAFEEHSNHVVQGSQITSIDQKESVSISTRFTALINATIEIASTATDEAKLKGIKKLDELMKILQHGQIDSTSSSGPHFSNLTYLPSHKNIDQQRFHSTKKKQTSNSRLTKPTEMHKISIMSTMNSEGQANEVIHTDFDHVYYNASSKPQ